jgi:TonB family protein
MNELFRYLVLSGISMILLYCIYALFLRKDTFFMVNRIYLIGTIIFSLVAPLMINKVNLHLESTGYGYLLETITITPEKIETAVVNNFSLFQTIFIVFITGAALFLCRFVFQIMQLVFLVKKYGITRNEGLKLVFINRNYSPFSFFNLIFINEKETGTEYFRNILEHELVHVRQKHTLDLILVELLTIIQWFNPIVWFYRHSLKTIHEYLADEGVLVKGINQNHYQELLLRQVLGIQVNDLTNNFNHSLLKRRIIMMTRTKSTALAKLKFLLVIPAMLLLAFIFSISVGNIALGQTESGKTTSKGSKETPPTPPAAPDKNAKAVSQKQDTTTYEYNKSAFQKPYTTGAVMPQFPGGTDKLIEFIKTNVRYPEDAKKAGITGTVFVSFTVTTNGKITDIKILRGVSSSLDAESIRVVKAMPDWKPGKNEKGEIVPVEYTLPIKFALDSKK